MDQGLFVDRVFAHFRQEDGQVALFVVACTSLDPAVSIPGQVMVIGGLSPYMIFDPERFTTATGVVAQYTHVPSGCAVIRADQRYDREEDAFAYFRECLIPIQGAQEPWPEHVEFLHVGTIRTDE